MRLLFIVGKKRSGKDTTADYICDTYDSVKYQFGGPIKDILYEAWKCSDELPDLSYHDFHGTGIDREMPLAASNKDITSMLMHAVEIAAQNYGLRNKHQALINLNDAVVNNIEAWSIRRLMQTLGTDICVNADKMVWVRLFTSYYTEAIGADKQPAYFVVPDTRQENEIAVGRALGAAIIHVVGATEDSSDDHITERGLAVADGDYVIHNTGTLDELYHKINNILETL